MWEGQRGKECEESGALFRTRFARAVAALLRFSRLLVNSNVRFLLKRKRLKTLKGGCKFELIIRIPKVYSCIFQTDFPSLRAFGACEPLLEKQNITKQKTLCGVRASELLCCTKFVQVWLIFTNYGDRPVVLGVVNGFISLKAGIGVPRIGTFLSSDSASDFASYSIVITRGTNQSQYSVPSTVACCERLICRFFLQV